MALKHMYDYEPTDKTEVSEKPEKEESKEIKQEVYVNSKCEAGSEKYYIIVRVKGKTEGRICYDYENEYIFRTDKKLSKLSCINCEDDKFLDVATRSAIEHMNKLRNIKKPVRSIFQMLMSNGVE